ncbi:MORC family CW-type zinc finger protein 3-like isoform X2 [Tachysurus vachellii]|uniref:MORC family CW-type zinc finger protein 3-like isoform X2 n=1 Tax=Tachysurus vachellii TaxID=175792 RepID=UPI00296AC2C4|nr:MORC family CW-type zinc finger protein 3-like isoform X2 [Tachysurus vachellii]
MLRCFASDTCALGPAHSDLLHSLTTMAAETERGIPISAVSPRYLHTNSTSHTGPFSAIAALIDNAYDPDVSAKQIWIDKTVFKGQDCFIFMDNGKGMDYDKMHKMLSFGFSDKQAVKGHVPVGLYGNGFKSGSMRLGKDAIVFSKKDNIMCVGLLSQTYLERTGAQNVIVPIVTFTTAGETVGGPRKYEECLHDILTYSLFSTKEELLTEFNTINGPYCTNSTGTRIIIWNLRKMSSGELEFDFLTDRYDIRLPVDVNEGRKVPNKGPESQISPSESEYSLRAYSSILYLKPKMHIIIRGQKVKTQLISKSLAFSIQDTYKPTFLKNGIKITFGYNTISKEHYGLMMYHKNRLIKAYEPAACQRKANKTGVRVIGVMECDYLIPMHNKQDFEKTEEYRKTIQNVSTKLEEYWKEVRYRSQKSNCSVPVEDDVNKPDQVWVQCDQCIKWRKLPDGIDLSQLPYPWFCYMNADPQFRSCTVEEEPEYSDGEQPRNQKTYKQDEKNQKLQKEKIREQTELEQKEADEKLKLALTKESADHLKAQKDLMHQLKHGSPVQGTPYSPTPNSRRQRNADPAPSPISTRKKKPIGPSQENVEMKRARIGDSFGSNSPSRPSTSTALPEDTSIATQTQQVKEDEGDRERMEKEKGSTDGENVISCSESENNLKRNTNKQLIRNEEIRVQQKSVPSSKLSPSTVESEEELKHMEVSDDIRQGCQTSTKLQSSVLDVLEAQKQQDKLLELLEEVTKERDESRAQLLSLDSQVDELRSQLLELNQSMTSPKEAQDYKVLYLQGKKEIKLLQEELSGLKLEKEERERKGQQSMLECDDDLACQMDILLREIDQRNKEREELQVKHSAATDPELVQHCTDSSAYRFLCSHAGVFFCKMTNIYIEMKGSGEVLYTVVPWDKSQLHGMGQFMPAGPLYNINCSEDSIRYLHLPHCEIPTEKNEFELSVAHFSEGNVEIIQPLNITSTHVIFKVHGLSIFGLLKKRIFLEKPISGQVLLFYNEKRKNLHIHLLPGNVSIEEVRKLNQCNTYIQCSSLCQLTPGKKYRPMCEPYSYQPKVETFGCDYGPNHHITFEVILNNKVEDLTLGLLDESGQEVWEPRQIFLTAESKEADPAEKDKGAEFVDKHRDTLIQRVFLVLEIADTLLTKKLIRDELYNDIKEATTPQKKMRILYSCLDSGGRTVKAEFYKILKQKQPEIVNDLDPRSRYA